jgi:glycosyltransferase involved in cell wall biosynthesis
VLFVGDALPDTQEYKRRISEVREQLGLRAIVTFAGVRRDALHIIRRSNVLLSTSLHEGFPNVVIEAMSVGTPVASTDYSDIRLILPNRWQVVDTRDPCELAEAVIRCNTERQQVAAQQAEWLCRNATLDIEVDRLEAVYRKYLAA